MTDTASATPDVPTDDAAAGCGGCNCGAGGCGSGARTPVLDARTIDPMIRQSAMFGVLIGLPAGGSAEIVTDESPDLVLTLIEGQFAGQYEVAAARVDDDEWRTTFTRQG